jgi:hypothetical protein
MSKIVNQGETMHHTVRFRESESGILRIEKYAKIKGVKRSDFIRMAINHYMRMIDSATKPILP